MRSSIGSIIIALCCVVGVAGGMSYCSEETTLKLASLFCEHAVLQRKKDIPVWGWAAPGQDIEASLAGQTQKAKASSDGYWKVSFAPMKAGGPYKLTVKGDKEISVNDILIGDVWLCSGQSNMGFLLSEDSGYKKELESSDNSNLRFFSVNWAVSAKPLKDVRSAGGSGWQVAARKTIGKCSAVSYHFGKELNRHLDVPIGLICSARGGTRVEAWTSEFGIRKVYEKAAGKDFKVLAAEVKASGPDNLVKKPNLITSLYNGMINGLIPYSIKGVIWYQGESNDTNAYEYRQRFPTLIQDWRYNWKDSDLPFLFVSIANYRDFSNIPGDPKSSWAVVRESQAKALWLPNTGMAVAIDLGDAKNIHPESKVDVGKRLALVARGVAYKEDIVCCGPVFNSVKIEGDAIRIGFDSVGSGLVAKGGELSQFAIAGNDRKFIWAKAAIHGASVVVSSPQIRKPVAVRYAWADNPEGCNLYNKEGMPAVPFRTDNWPVITQAKK